MYAFLSTPCACIYRNSVSKEQRQLSVMYQLRLLGSHCQSLMVITYTQIKWFLDIQVYTLLLGSWLKIPFEFYEILKIHVCNPFFFQGILLRLGVFGLCIPVWKVYDPVCRYWIFDSRFFPVCAHKTYSYLAGYIPRLTFKYGNTYKRKCDDCIEEFKTNLENYEAKQDELRRQTTSCPRLTAISYDPLVRDHLNLFRDTHPLRPILMGKSWPCFLSVCMKVCTGCMCSYVCSSNNKPCALSAVTEAEKAV